MQISEKADRNALLNLQECKDKKTTLSSYPIKLYIEPTMACNLHCSYCYPPDFRSVKPLDLNLFYTLEKQLFEHVSEVNIFLRGEPTLYKNFSTMLDTCAKYPFVTKFFSNLSYKNDEILRKIVQAGSWLNVSFDGFSSSLRKGINNNFVIKNIKFLQAVQKEIKQDKFHLRIAVVVGKNNVKNLKDIIDLTSTLGIKEIMLGCIDVFNDIKQYELTSEDAVYFSDAVKQADSLKIRISTPTHIGGQKLEKTNNWNEFSLPVDKYFPFYCENINPDVEAKNCPYPWIQTVIQSDGTVLACCQRQMHLGKFTVETDFMRDIWNNDAYQKLRSINDFTTCGETIHLCNMVKYSIWGGYQL